jgi:hypothetical protein
MRRLLLVVTFVDVWAVCQTADNRRTGVGVHVTSFTNRLCYTRVGVLRPQCVTILYICVLGVLMAGILSRARARCLFNM